MLTNGQTDRETSPTTVTIAAHAHPGLLNYALRVQYNNRLTEFRSAHAGIIIRGVAGPNKMQQCSSRFKNTKTSVIT